MEDSAMEAELLGDLLALARRPRFAVQRAATLGDALEALPRLKPDVVLLDLGLPDSTGLDGLRRVKAALPAAVVIVRTGFSDERLAVEALAEGAEDYLVKDGQLNGDLIVRSIRFAVARNAAEVERRRAIAELREAQRIARVGSWRLNVRSDGGTWSLEMYRLFGRDPKLGWDRAREWLQYVHPDDQELVRTVIEPGPPGQDYEFDFRIRAGDGIERTLHLIAHPDADDSDCLVGTVQDVTELRAVERALIASRAELVKQRELLSGVLDHAPIGMAMVGEPSGRFVRVNRAMCEMIGYTEEELGERSFPEITHHDDVAGFLAGAQALLDGELDVYRSELRYRHSDGHVIWAESSVSLISDETGRPQHFVTQIADVSDRLRYEAELRRLATHDPLTGLANSRLFHQRLRDAVAQAMRHDRPLSVVVLDLDHFKEVNDAHGHLVGDQTLETVAGLLSTVVREGELLARIGGEEFAWILPDADLTGAYAAAERARSVVSAAPLPVVGTVTVSAGVGVRDELVDPIALYERADQALYAAKRAGRNQTVRWAAILR